MNLSIKPLPVAYRGLLTGLAILSMLAISFLAYGGRDAKAVGNPATSTNDAHADAPRGR